jgi:poly-gamma-glutamate synthesis protein (capsule biosynthesis protein)
VLYSLGNFASHQRELPRRSSIILYLELKRVAEDRAVVSGVRYLPIHMEQKGKPEQFSVLPIGREGQPADVLDHIIGVYGPHNRIDPSEPLDLTPHCDPKWTPR